MFTSRVPSLALLAVLLLGGTGLAAESIILDEITIRGERQQANEENLTIREVRESPARDIGEALQSVPGLEIVRKGAIANDIVLRGFQRDNLNMFLDGVRLHGGCPSRMDPPSFHFDFAEVESIEVIKGPYDLQNPGSMAGMINAISKKPKKGPGATANLSYGSFNYLDASLTGSYGGETHDGLLGYAHKSSDVPESGDGKLLTDIYPATSPNRYRPETLDSKAYETDTFWAKTGYTGSNSRTDISYAYQDADHVLYPYLFMDADYDRTHRVNLTTTLKELSNAVRDVQFQVWYNQVDHLMNDVLRVSSLNRPRPYMMQTDAETQTYGAKLKATLPLGSGALTGGVDAYRRNWDALNTMFNATAGAYMEQPMIPDVDIDNLGAFAEYTRPLSESVTLKGGARIDVTTVEANKLTDARLASLYQPYYPGVSLATDTDFTEPSANLQLTWRTTDNLELFAGLASASRTPDQQELYIGLQRASSNWLGNPALDATRNNQLDLGAKWSGETIFASAAVFYSDLSDYIYVTDVADPDGAGPLRAARTYQNIDATMYGAEFGSQIALPLDLFLKGTLAWVRGENDDSSQPLAEIPPLSGSVSLRYDNGLWFAEATERFADRQDRVDTSLNELETPGWAATDLKAGATWDQWSLFGGVNNLFDSFYYSHLSYQRDPFASGVKVPEMGRFLYVNLSYRF